MLIKGQNPENIRCSAPPNDGRAKPPSAPLDGNVGRGRSPSAPPPLDRPLLEKIAKGLSTPDPKAEIQRDRKGEIIYDADLKDTEIVPYKESIDDYMAREVLPHLPGAKAFFLEDPTAKKPVIKTGAEFPFTRYFYKYLEPESSAEIMKELVALDAEIAADFAALKGEVR